MREILFQLDLFTSPETRAASERVLNKGLEFLYQADLEFLRQHPDAPDIYTPGLVRYRREPIPAEVWKAIPYCIRDGYADCEDLACWLAAQRTIRDGRICRPDFSSQQIDGLTVYHIVVRHADGSIEDPSKVLGMV